MWKILKMTMHTQLINYLYIYSSIRSYKINVLNVTRDVDVTACLGK